MFTLAYLIYLTTKITVSATDNNKTHSFIIPPSTSGTIDWGDNTSTDITLSEDISTIDHTYSTSGIFDITISDGIDNIKYGNDNIAINVQEIATTVKSINGWEYQLANYTVEEPTITGYIYELTNYNINEPTITGYIYELANYNIDEPSGSIIKEII